MSIPIPSQENYPAAFAAWRLYEPTDSRIVGIAIVVSEMQTYWSINYTCVGKQFLEPSVTNVKKVRAILQSKCPPNCVLRKVSFIIPCKSQCYWQVTYTVQTQLSAVTYTDACINSLSKETISKSVKTKDVEVVIETPHKTTDVELIDQKNLSNGDGSSRLTNSIEIVRSDEHQSGCSSIFDTDYTVKDKLQTVKLIKSKVRDELTKPVGGNFISLKHKNKFFAMLRIASKNIISKVTNNIEHKRIKDRQIYGKGADIYHSKFNYKACPPPQDINVNSNLKYFEKTDLATVVAMGIIYDVPEKYVAGNYEYYKESIHIWAKGTLIKHGIPLLSQEEGKKVFPLVMKRTGLSDTEIKSLKISTHAVNKSLFVTV